MNDLRQAAQQALEALKSVQDHRPNDETNNAIDALCAALAQQDEPVQDVLLSMAGLALDALEHERQAAARAGRNISMLSLNAIEGLRDAFRAASAEPEHKPPCALLQIPSRECDCGEEPALSRCPQCGGPADNGHDRSIPPNPYLCTKCMAQPESAATTQQPVEQTPPSDYRRGYWAGFEIGKREGRIEAEDALAQPAPEPVAVQPQGRTGLTWYEVIQGLHAVLNDESEDHLSAAWHRARLLDAIDLMAANPPAPPQQPVPKPEFWGRVAARQASRIKELETALAQATKNHDPEPCAMRHSFDGYGYCYIDAGSGSDWRTRVKDAEPLYAAPPRAIEQAHGIKE